MKRYLFIDPGKRDVGWAIYDTDYENYADLMYYGYYKISPKVNPVWPTLLKLANYFEKYNIHIVGIEMAPTFHYNRHRKYNISKSLHELKRATQCIIDGFIMKEKEIIEIPVQKSVGNLPKNYHLLKATKYYGATLEELIYNGNGKLKKFPTHTADAICMGANYLIEKIVLKNS